MRKRAAFNRDIRETRGCKEIREFFGFIVTLGDIDHADRFHVQFLADFMGGGTAEVKTFLPRVHIETEPPGFKTL